MPCSRNMLIISSMALLSPMLAACGDARQAPVTLPAGAQAGEELLPYLSNGEQVILKDSGHASTFWNSQPEARAHMLNTFFDTGQVDASLYTYQPLDFHVGRGWPRLAKILVAVLVLIVVTVVAAVWSVTCRVQRTRVGRA
jgi:hypothetical protein